MKTWDEINIEETLVLEDFLTLFASLPLNEEEITELNKFYFPMYITFLDAGVQSKEAWTAVRNLFIIKNQKIVSRLK